MESERVHQWLLREAGRRGPVVEIGCGDGALSIDLARRGLEVTAVDLDADALQKAREAAEAAGCAGSIAWLQADGQKLSLVPSGTHRVAILAFVLHHMNDPQAGLDEAWRMLAPGGRLLVAEMLPRGPDAGDACHRTTLGQWLAWLTGLEPDGFRLNVLPGQEWLLAALGKQIAVGVRRHPPVHPEPEEVRTPPIHAVGSGLGWPPGPPAASGGATPAVSGRLG